MYITFRSKFHEPEIQLTFEKFFDWFDKINTPRERSEKYFTTVTRIIEPNHVGTVKARYAHDLEKMQEKIHEFHTYLTQTEYWDSDKPYNSFTIPKHNGGVRRIDAPEEDFKGILREVKDLFEKHLKMLPHNNAFAYVPGRSTLDALQIHQRNNSKWFLKLDIKNFFNSTSPEWTYHQLTKLFPIQPLLDTCSEQIFHILQYASLEGGFPQGSPFSPYVTNLVMLPCDHEIKETLHNYNRQHFKYTRYADDIIISSKYHFNWKEIQDIIAEIIHPYEIKKEKTRYGSSAGRNWNLGLMLNKDNEITIGHKRKERMKATIHNFLTSTDSWSRMDTQVLLGQIAYYSKVEPDWINATIQKYSQKTNKDFHALTKEILKV